MTKQIDKRKLTEEESIIFDCWYQFASRTKKGMWDGGKGSLQSCESYLKEHKIINSLGNKRPEIIW